MAWKKDLEKLKQSLGPEAATPPKPAPPPKPKPAEAKPIEDEDKMFLSAMGHRPKPQAPPMVAAPAAPEPVPAEPPPSPGSEFASAMGNLKGIVALHGQEPARPSKGQAGPAAPAPRSAPASLAVPKAEPAPAVEPPPRAVPPAPEVTEVAETVPVQAVQINLAAGMAIDVDASLDLKGHGRNDAEERLKERILDAQVLGWRTLHVVLGPAEELRQMLLGILASPAASRITRYAQAPIPMGGSQAWILYFRISPAPPEAN